MKTTDQIRKALRACVKAGIAIERGFCFDWPGGVDGMPRAVNWMGAVLWMAGASRSPTLFADLCRTLDIDHAWFYRFSIGFDNGRALSILHPETLLEIGKDGVSADGLRIMREFVRRPV